MYFEYVLDDCDQSDLFRRRVDEQRYSQTDCNVWLKSGIQKGDATASVFSHGSGAPRILRVRGRRRQTLCEKGELFVGFSLSRFL